MVFSKWFYMGCINKESSARDTYFKEYNHKHNHLYQMVIQLDLAETVLLCFLS